MNAGAYRFDLPTHHRSIIKVMGIGGGGSNAVNNMYSRGIKDVSFVICNTDAQALENSPIQSRLQIGIDLTGGLGAGANPEVGKNAAIESKEDIKTLLNDGTKMLFVTAGMGGGTGTGAAPVIAGISRKLGILTVGIVTMPFSFEGKKKLQQAQEGIKQLREQCDTVLVILNDRLRAVLGNLSIGNAFAQADNVLTTAAKSIAEIITVPGYVNVDFEDVKTVMKNAGAAVMGSGQAEGEERALKAAEAALASPLLDYKDIHGAKKILLSIVSGQESELQMDELTMITDYIQDKIGADAEMIFGHSSDAQLQESLRVTVIATGFDKKNEEQSASESAPRYTSSYATKRSTRQAYLFEDLSQQPASTRRSTTKRSTKPHKPTTAPATLGEELPSPYGTYQQQHIQEDINLEEAAAVSSAAALDEKTIKEWTNIPAYLRKGVQLQALPTDSATIRRKLEEDEDSTDRA